MKLEVITRKPDTPSEKTPLLFVHGILHGAWCWDEYFLPYFAEHGYHASALSLRNHGDSEKVSNWRWIGIQDYVEDVAQIAAQIEAETGERPVIIGHSMGGLVTQKYLEKYDAPASVLVASCPSHGVWQTLFRVIVNQPLAFIQINLRLNLKALASTPRLAQWAFFSQSMPLETVQHYSDRFDNESYRVFLDMLLFALPRTSRTQMPMLVVAGADDTLFDIKEEGKTARAYGAEFHSFEGIAHDMMLEEKWESVAEYMLTWLNNTVK